MKQKRKIPYKIATRHRWFQDEILQIAKAQNVSEIDAETILIDLILEKQKKHGCTLNQAFEAYNIDRCHRIDRELFIETMVENGMDEKTATAMADGCVPFF